MLVIAIGVPVHILVLGALHPHDFAYIALVDGLLGSFALAAWWSLGRMLRHWAELLTFVLSLAVGAVSILLAVTGPRMVELAIAYLVFIPPLVALVMPWRSWTEIRWLGVYGIAAIVFFADVAPDGSLTVGDRQDLVFALMATLGAALTGHVLLFRRHVRSFVQVQALGRLQRRETKQRSELQRVYRSLEVTARTDELTGTGNRLKLHEDLKAARSRLARTGVRFGLLEIDLDHFKAVNDSFGHLAGDEVLRRVAKSLRDSLRGDDSVYRYGGEEFLVLLNDISGGVLEVSERIRSTIEGLGLIHSPNPPGDFVTVSVGSAAIGPADLEATNDDWFSRVDVALYQAKADGRNRVAVAPTTTHGPPNCRFESARCRRRGPFPRNGCPEPDLIAGDDPSGIPDREMTVSSTQTERSGRAMIAAVTDPARDAELDPERQRLEQARTGAAPWYRWGPYLADRQWGPSVRTTRRTVPPGITCPTTTPARGPIAGARTVFSASATTRRRLCFAIALWNGRDPILKERLFGLSGPQGNHGEDVKEAYFYADATPTASYLRALYKYPQAEFPYAALVAENARRGKGDPEFELADTGVFDGDRYFDVEVEYAKVDADDIAIRIVVTNRGPDPAPIHLLPTLWFRNTWAWGLDDRRPSIRVGAGEAPPGAGKGGLATDDPPHRSPGPRDVLADGRGRRTRPPDRERIERRAPVGRPVTDSRRQGRVPRRGHTGRPEPSCRSHGRGDEGRHPLRVDAWAG